MITLLCALSSATASEGPSLRRFALLLAANDGGRERPVLQYADDDARSVSSVLQELGGVAPADAVVELDPDRERFDAALQNLTDRVREARGDSRRTEVVVYYSGHSDGEGLLLGEDRLTYTDFRARLSSIEADVQVVILDSCASGALVRNKGGVLLAPFLVDRSSDVEGTAILTSSSADEVSQEADWIGGSFFTHALVSGLRGAADSTGDGQVTIGEAYRFAFDETLARTTATQRGTQHPNYDIQLSGTGDLVLTDLREAGAVLRIAAEVGGRVFVRDAQQRLVAELQKATGMPLDLAVPAGRYEVTVEDEANTRRTMVDVGLGESSELSTDRFDRVARRTTQSRGDDQSADDYKRVPLTVGFVPPLSTRGGRKVDSNFSFGVLVGFTNRLSGLGLSSLGDVVGGDAKGAQVAGIATVAGGEVRGVQLAGVGSVAGGLDGAQVSGVASVVRGDAKGAQFAGVLATAGGDANLQVATVNLAGGHADAQLGVINATGPGTGGVQLGVINIGPGNRDVQVGVVNIGGTVRGTQIGVVNIAERSDHTIGVVNAVRDGQHHGIIWADELGMVNAGLKLGGRVLYTTAGIGLTYPGERSGYVSTLVLGGHFQRPDGRVWLDVEGGVRQVGIGPRLRGVGLVPTMRASVGFSLAKHVSPFVGLSGNVGVDVVNGEARPIVPFITTGTTPMWLGLQAGVQF